MSYRSMLIEKFTKLLDPILHDKNQKTDWTGSQWWRGE
jgi:hypothetical protein